MRRAKLVLVALSLGSPCATVCACSATSATRDDAAPRLRWAASEACVLRYRVRVGAGDWRRIELDFREPREDRWGRRVGRMVSDPPGAVRRVTLTPTELAPAAPDAICRLEPVDPVEHVIALGWPRLPDRRLATPDGETQSQSPSWRARDPDGLCDELACVARDGSPTGLPCTAPPWELTLTRIEGDVAVVSGSWSAPGPNGEGDAQARSEHRIDLRRGRLLDARVDVGGAAPLRTQIEYAGCAP